MPPVNFAEYALQEFDRRRADCQNAITQNRTQEATIASQLQTAESLERETTTLLASLRLRPESAQVVGETGSTSASLITVAQHRISEARTALGQIRKHERAARQLRDQWYRFW